jgi:hypothetical protein
VVLRQLCGLPVEEEREVALWLAVNHTVRGVHPFGRDRSAHGRRCRDGPSASRVEYPAPAAGDRALLTVEGDLSLPDAAKGKNRWHTPATTELAATSARLATAPRPPSPRRGGHTFPWPAGQRAGCLSVQHEVGARRRRSAAGVLGCDNSAEPTGAGEVAIGPRPITATVSPGCAAASFKLTPPTWSRRAKGAASRPTPAGSRRHTN